MSIDKPDISFFGRAIGRLEEGLARYYKNESDEQIRDGLIHRFKFTYEVGHEILKRYLEYASPNPSEICEMLFQDIIRTANEQNLLLGEWSDWRNFRAMRARSTHAYREAIAIEVVSGIPRFVEEAVHLHDKLRERLE